MKEGKSIASISGKKVIKRSNINATHSVIHSSTHSSTKHKKNLSAFIGIDQLKNQSAMNVGLLSAKAGKGEKIKISQLQVNSNGGTRSGSKKASARQTLNKSGVYGPS